jgi:hypothetical protein
MKAISKLKLTKRNSGAKEAVKKLRGNKFDLTDKQKSQNKKYLARVEWEAVK